MKIWTALIFLSLAAVPAAARNGLHPECNITMPCIVSEAPKPTHVKAARPSRAVQTTRLRVPLPAPRLHNHEAFNPPANDRGVTALERPARYVAGRLVCALNVGLALAERGIRGTGSALARSYDRWGAPSSPVPGAVAVTDRRGGGHVAVVSRVEGSRVWVWNPSTRGRGWREVEYTHRRARYRVAGG